MVSLPRRTRQAVSSAAKRPSVKSTVVPMGHGGGVAVHEVPEPADGDFILSARQAAFSASRPGTLRKLSNETKHSVY